MESTFEQNIRLSNLSITWDPYILSYLINFILGFINSIDFLAWLYSLKNQLFDLKFPILTPNLLYSSYNLIQEQPISFSRFDETTFEICEQSIVDGSELESMLLLTSDKNMPPIEQSFPMAIGWLLQLLLMDLCSYSAISVSMSRFKISIHNFVIVYRRMDISLDISRGEVQKVSSAC